MAGNPRAFVMGVVMFLAAGITFVIMTWIPAGLMEGFYNNTGGYIPAGIIANAQKGAGLSVYNGMANLGIQNYMINAFYALDLFILILGAWLIYQGAFIEQGAEQVVDNTARRIRR